MALKLGELVAILRTDNRQLEKGLDDGRRKARQTGQAMEGDAATAAAGIARRWGDAGRRGGEEFTRGADGRLRDGRGRFVSAGTEFGDALSQGIGAGARVAVGSLQDVQSGLSQVAGPLGTIAPMIAGVGAAALFAAPAIGVFGGMLGSLPGIIGGLGALTGVLGLGFMGLDDAFKKTGGSGGSGGAMVDTAYQIAQAERRVRDANEEVLASQENLTRARQRAKETQDDLRRAEERAAENLRDLASDLEGAQLSQERAAMRVTEAQAEYNKALGKGDPKAIVEADLALREAKHSAKEAADRVEDLGQEQAEAAKKGVKGSDEVKAAQERHRAATDEVAAARKRERAAVEGVADAEHALAQARKSGGGGGGGGAGQAITKLAPAAEAAVRAIKKLKPAFEELRLHVQEKLFAGVGPQITKLADAWKGTLKERLGSMATTVNGIFHTAAESASKPKFIENMNTGMAAFERLVGKVGGALSGPFVDAWGRLSAAAAPFIDALGDEFSGLIKDFSTWIQEADDSGKLESFFKTAAGFFRQVMSIGKTVVGIVGELFGIIWGSAEEKNPLDSFQGALEKVRAWLADPENQKKIQDFWTKLTDYTSKFIELMEKIGPIVGPVMTVVGVAVDLAAEKIEAIKNVIGAVGDAISWVGKNAPKWWQKVKDAAGAAKDWVVGKWDAMMTWFEKLPGKISKKASGMWNGIKTAFKSAINYVIDGWNGLSFGIPGGSFMGMSWPPMRLDTPNIPRLAQGGIVPATPGGRLAVIGEGGQDEAVIPLSRLQQMLGRTVLELRSSGSAVDDFLIEILRGAIKPRGGNVQVVLGQ
ncbi:hypothetical protein GCM10010112_67950 [Actinoplanes lobatus]|uniref:Putative nucleic acid-binding Zn-ribbon protein n=1 Tax=Actinoplanes lobatus TaxID=113568 RepID=A0A7W7HEN0_9ACTN|nr:hypothetical protein [Actinoplanes lobatus]MBB4749125.1 putative nucleic acid-binding Zn-ribbon protein [Actinoplanes lobatus]GGN86409.1 hypothetical protein GCM10010112_67950 [Actinoplanes lobatus]GIE42777.1 hypothetical protein Alo02nite_56750 [Actinoplanes lobatus]